MKTLLCTIILLVAAGLLVTALPTAAQSSIARVRIAPLQSEVQVGEALLVAVEVVDVENLYGFDIIIEFDPTVIELVDVDDEEDGLQVGFGTFLEPGLVIVNGADNTQGVARLMMTQLNPSPAKSGSGVLIGLLARGISAETQTPLTITKAELAGSRGEAITSTTEDGTLAVLAEPPNAPTPTPIVLQSPGTPIAILLTETPQPAATATSISATATPTTLPTATATATATPSPSPTPTETPMPTATATDDVTVTSEATATAVNEDSAEIEPTPTSTPTPTSQATVTRTPESQPVVTNAAPAAQAQPTLAAVEVEVESMPPPTDAQPAEIKPTATIQTEVSVASNVPSDEQPPLNQIEDVPVAGETPIVESREAIPAALAIVTTDSSALTVEQIGANQALQPAVVPQVTDSNEASSVLLLAFLGIGMVLIGGGTLFAWISWRKT